METIRLKCQNCQGTLDVDPNREVISCPYCGEKTLVPESDEVKIARIAAETTKVSAITRQKNIIVIAIAAIIIIILLLKLAPTYMVLPIISIIALLVFGYYTATDDSREAERKEKMQQQQMEQEKKEKEFKEQKKQEIEKRKLEFSNPVCTPISGDSAYRKNYEDISELFSSAGFTNIKTVKEGYSKEREKTYGTLKNQICEMTINGDEDFEKNEIFEKDALIIITYYSNE